MKLLNNQISVRKHHYSFLIALSFSLYRVQVKRKFHQCTKRIDLTEISYLTAEMKEACRLSLYSSLPHTVVHYSPLLDSTN